LDLALVLVLARIPVPAPVMVVASVHSLLGNLNLKSSWSACRSTLSSFISQGRVQDLIQSSLVQEGLLVMDTVLLLALVVDSELSKLGNSKTLMPACRSTPSLLASQGLAQVLSQSTLILTLVLVPLVQDTVVVEL
jgi:hypothetical protein